VFWLWFYTFCFFPLIFLCNTISTLLSLVTSFTSFIHSVYKCLLFLVCQILF
jgi:hypothetical protein